MPTPNFEDAPDGSSSINHTGSSFTQEVQCFWEDIHPYPTNPVGHSSEFPPHPSYADGSTPAVNPLSNLNTAIGASHVAVNPNRRIEARMFSQGECPPPPQTATQVNEAQRAARRSQVEDLAAIIEAPRRTERRPRRRGVSDPDAAIRKDPNAWSLREAVELCKLLEVVVPEAGFHIALTGGLLYKEGRRKDCDLMFYQIRQVEPNYEVLWKYLTVAGIIRHPSYLENGWLVKATYRGKVVDCLFPNAKKVKKTGAAKADCYKAAQTASTPAPIIYHRIPDDLAEFLATTDPAPVPSHAVGEQNTAFGAQSLASNNAGTSNIEIGSPPAPRDFIDRSFAAQREIRAERQAEAAREADRDTIDAAVAAARIVESAASAFISPPAPIPAVAQWEEPF